MLPPWGGEAWFAGGKISSVDRRRNSRLEQWTITGDLYE